MFINILKYSALIVVLLRMIEGEKPLAVSELSDKDSEYEARNVVYGVMRRYMDESVDPCEDFYAFACGNYAKYNPNNPYQPKINLLHTIKRAMDEKIKTELQVDSANDTEVDRKVKNYYRACMNLPALKGVFQDKLKQVLKEFGRMPALLGAKWQESNFDWAETVGEIIHKTGVSIILGTDVLADFANNTIARTAVARPGFTLVTPVPIAQHLQTFLGVDKELAETTALEIIDFEVALRLSTSKVPIPLNKMLTLTRADEVQQKFQRDFDFDFQKFLKLAFDSEPHEFLLYRAYAEGALKVVAQTPKRVVANYIFYIYLTNFMYIETPGGMEDYCMDDTTQRLNKQLDNMFYRRYFSDQMKDAIYSMWRELKVTFRHVLNSPRLGWLQQATRDKALEKLKAMRLVINSYEHNNFEQEFAQLDLNNHDYVHNIRAILMQAGQRARANVHTPPKPVDLGAVGSFTPYYAAEENAVKVPVGVLQPYYAWSMAYHNSFNFATLGSVIAHEMVHGFDDKGRFYDPKGNIVDWWDPLSAVEYGNRSQCLADQYSKFIFAGNPLPAKPSQSENIADNGGVRLAYEAYLHWYGPASRDNPYLEQRTIPRFEYNNRQVFFISYAQLWCSSVALEYMIVQPFLEHHAPEKFRVIGPLSNYEEFSTEFECPRGSAMNPESKCEIY